MSTTKPGFEALEEIASTWAVRRAAGLTSDLQAEFERWLAADPLHYAAFAEADLALSVLSAPATTRERQQLRDEMVAWEEARLAQRKQRRRGLAFSALGLAAAAIFLVMFSSIEQPQPTIPAPIGTMTPRPLFQRLPDRSLVELNANTDIAVEFTTGERLVRLIRGEAHFIVAKDSARPFIVSVGRVKIRAVGTQFNVRCKPDAVDVLLTEGKVRVSDDPASDHVRETDLTPGHRTTVALTANPPQTLEAAAVSPAEIQRELAWRQMRFELSNATLEQAVAWFNEQSQVQFVNGDAELRPLRLSGICWADNSAQFAELVATSLDLKVVRESPERIVFRPR